ncbi:MAG: inositol phosphate phosphatase SopB [Janthinobacterium lividum]
MGISFNQNRFTNSATDLTRTRSREDAAPPDSPGLARTESMPRLDTETASRLQNNMRSNFLSRVFSFSGKEAKKFADSVPTPLSTDMRHLFQQRLEAAERVLACHPDAFCRADDIQETLRSSFARKRSQLQHNELPKGEHKTFEKDLVKLLTESMYTVNLAGRKDGSKATALEARRLFKEAVVQHLNDQPWHTIEKQFVHEDRTFTDTMTPASQIGFGGHDLFEESYHGKGISSGTSKEKRHAVNLYATTLAIDNDNGSKRTVFQGIRHGINSAYGLKGKTERANAALARSTEVVAAALALQKPEELQQAMRTGAPISLRLSSTSLVTPMDGFGQSEGRQMKDQLAAWDTLNARSRANGGIEIPMRDAHGRMKKVTVKLEAAALNFGVNEVALTHQLSIGDHTVAKLGGGWDSADKINRRGLRTLLGAGIDSHGAPGGWVKEYLDSHPGAQNAGLVRELGAQIGEIWTRKSHHTDRHKDASGKPFGLGDPYKIASRVALLTQEIGATPCYNCKSGKDRTGMMDSEVKFLASHFDLYGYLPPVGAGFHDSGQSLYQKAVLETGSGDVQRQNTAAPGNKVFKQLIYNNLSLRQRLNDDDKFNQGRGLSAQVRS